MILETREERIKLLKSGFTEKQIEALYIDLNHIETLQIHWNDAATNRTFRRKKTIPAFKNQPFRPTEESVRVQAAPSLPGLKSKKLEMGEFTEEDKAKMWAAFQKVWKAEKEKTGG